MLLLKKKESILNNSKTIDSTRVKTKREITFDKYVGQCSEINSSGIRLELESCPYHSLA